MPATSRPELSTPKAFLSYSHASSAYIDRVVDLAASLRSHGVEVVLDQWHLREGQDLHAFMEQAVTDATITHVVALCDPTYAEKADNRRGGVGAEALILSPEVYANWGQERVIPVVMERDEHDQARVPTYLRGRRYIDLSSEESAVDGYEQLVRTLFGRPARTPPPLGSPPTFLDDTHVPLATAAAGRLARAAVVGHRADAAGRFADYLDRLLAVLTAEEITAPAASEEDLVQQVLASIARCGPYRYEFVGLCRDLARYGGDQPELYDRLHEFFEQVASRRLQHWPVRYDEAAETENLAFIGWELMLYASAITLREGHSAGLARLLTPMYVRSRAGGAGALRSLDAMEPDFPLLRWQRDRQQGRSREPAARLLRDRHEGDTPPFEAIMEADLVLWYRTATEQVVRGQWWPRTLVYAESIERLPLFIRAQSPTGFARLAPALGVADRAEFVRRFRDVPDDDFPRIGRYMEGRAAYGELLAIRPDE
jgi:hypothetical protein